MAVFSLTLSFQVYHLGLWRIDLDCTKDEFAKADVVFDFPEEKALTTTEYGTTTTDRRVKRGTITSYVQFIMP